jgi:hypothetical protein
MWGRFPLQQMPVPTAQSHSINAARFSIVATETCDRPDQPTRHPPRTSPLTQHLALLKVKIRKATKGKVIPVPGHGGPQACERLRLPHLLDNRLTDGGKVVSLRRRPLCTPQEDSWYSFLLEDESTPMP